MTKTKTKTYQKHQTKMKGKKVQESSSFFLSLRGGGGRKFQPINFEQGFQT
jgi:hypothetical protein